MIFRMAGSLQRPPSIVIYSYTQTQTQAPPGKRRNFPETGQRGPGQHGQLPGLELSAVLQSLWRLSPGLAEDTRRSCPGKGTMACVLPFTAAQVFSGLVCRCLCKIKVSLGGLGELACSMGQSGICGAAQ